MTNPGQEKGISGQRRQVTEETARRLAAALERTRVTRPVYHIRNSQIISALLGTVGIALFIVGVERAAEDTPVISNAYGSILVGLAILIVAGGLLQRLGGQSSVGEQTHGSDPTAGEIQDPTGR